MYDVKQINNAYEQAVYNTTEKIQFEVAYEQCHGEIYSGVLSKELLTSFIGLY